MVEDILNDIYGRQSTDSVIKAITVYDNINITGYEMVLSPTSKKVATELDANNMGNEIIEYIELVGKQFTSTYSKMLNVIDKMNELVFEGKYWNGLYGQGGILSGMGDSFFRGLIISKLCNDSDFDRKVLWVERILMEEPSLLQLLMKFKKKMETVNPIYNR